MRNITEYLLCEGISRIPDEEAECKKAVKRIKQLFSFSGSYSPEDSIDSKVDMVGAKLYIICAANRLNIIGNNNGPNGDGVQWAKKNKRKVWAKGSQWCLVDAGGDDPAIINWGKFKEIDDLWYKYADEDPGKISTELCKKLGIKSSSDWEQF